uniref:Uncharacterized protein n=1 Tax=Panagrolaimus sp. PS1159 TaxID=55785 RepID=A0AC35GSV6_9BILA
MPDSVIFYVAKNPKTAELYFKMVKTCKYFFVKQPIQNFSKFACCSNVPFEDIVAIAVKACQIYVTEPIITPQTIKELTKLLNFTKLRLLDLYNLSEVFNIDECYCYMKKNLHTKLFLDFDNQISDAFKN